MEILIVALVAVGFWLVWQANKSKRFDINKDGKIDMADAQAAVVKVEEAVVAEVKEVVAEVKQVAEKVKKAPKKPAAKKPEAKTTAKRAKK